MSETLVLILTLLAGMGLGVFFFGGLWWTVHRAVVSPRPGLWFLVSMVVRTSIVLLGFYFIAAGHLARLVLCLLGFVVARLIVTKISEPNKKSPRLAEEPRHAPEP